MSDVRARLRCMATGHPANTDTHFVGRPCMCVSCEVDREIERLQGIVNRLLSRNRKCVCQECSECGGYSVAMPDGGHLCRCYSTREAAEAARDQPPPCHECGSTEEGAGHHDCNQCGESFCEDHIDWHADSVDNSNGAYYCNGCVEAAKEAETDVNS